jgi:hypothetical protein
MQMYVSTAFSELMSTDPALMLMATDVHPERQVIDLLWIVASICFFVVATLFIILVVVYVRSVDGGATIGSASWGFSI